MKTTAMYLQATALVAVVLTCAAAVALIAGTEAARPLLYAAAAVWLKAAAIRFSVFATDVMTEWVGGGA